MRGKRNVNYIALLLLCVYFFGTTPFYLYHHHNKGETSHNQTITCTQTRDYDCTVVECKHKLHLTKVMTQCLLCDTHYIDTFLLFTSENVDTEKGKNEKLLDCGKTYLHLLSRYKSSRAPPEIA